MPHRKQADRSAGMTIVTKCAHPVGFGVTCDPVSGRTASGGFRGGRPELGNAAKKTVHRYHVSQHEPAPINWWPLILAAPIVFLPLGFERRGDVDMAEWVLAWAGVLAFLVLFGIALGRRGSGASRSSGSSCRSPCSALPTRHYVYTAVVFINYAACIVPWAVDGDRRRTARYTTMLVARAVRHRAAHAATRTCATGTGSSCRCSASPARRSSPGSFAPAWSSTASPRWPSASVSRATCTTCWVTRCRSSP